MTPWQDLRVSARLLGSILASRRVAVLTCCWASLATEPTVGLSLSTTSVFDTGGGDVDGHDVDDQRLSLDASGVLNVVTTMTCNGSAPGTTITGVQEMGR